MKPTSLCTFTVLFVAVLAAPIPTSDSKPGQGDCYTNQHCAPGGCEGARRPGNIFTPPGGTPCKATTSNPPNL
ncbi:unnamed protein product [Zymoseptoria tritici ST99CH_1A5]|uniref:CBM1 domain-containing protein n=1 Tax=Zymoseptoria tritici ST99CH_1A5 TaxID=1276529 RepID=A0A1Y6LHQ8_ZYMTR|nr:unnamed protein product [Zymoseptoria tritici ST99CH_3D1]SMY22928.1 unnamed protein product [Zymoseptoria tritici ST99CH_1A5]